MTETAFTLAQSASVNCVTLMLRQLRAAAYMILSRINGDFSGFSSGSEIWFMNIIIATKTCKRLLMELRRIGKAGSENHMDQAHHQKLHANQHKPYKHLK